MSTMTKTALSDCSYPESTAYNIRDDIDATITRLKVVINEKASLRKALRALFIRRREEALEQVRLANVHLCLVNEEEAAFCDDLMKVAASTNERLEGSGCVVNASANEVAMPTLFPIPTTSHGNGSGLDKVERRVKEAKRIKFFATPTENLTGEPFTASFDNTCQYPLKSPARSTHGSTGAELNHNRPLRTPARSTHGFEDNALPKSPARSTRGVFYESTRSPARSTHVFLPARSPTRSTHAFTNEPTGSPARSARGLVENSTRSRVRSTRGLFWEPPTSSAWPIHAFDPLRSPARSTHGLDPTRSPVRSARGLNDGPMPISPARSNRGLPGDAPPRLPARSTRGLEDTYLSLDGVGHFQRTSGTTQSSLPPFPFGGGYGSGLEESKKSPARPSATLHTTFAFGGSRFGASSITNTGFGFGATPTVNTTFGCSAGPTTNTGFAFHTGSQPPSATREPSPKPEPPEEPAVVVVASKKKKKGKKTKEASTTDFLTPEQPTADADSEERLVMEEIKLSEEDRLEAELKQMEAEEAEMAEQEREAVRLLAEAAENERIDRDLLEEEETQRVLAKESEYLHYLSLKEAAAVAEERLSMVQAELDALEAQKLVVLRQVESAREQKASCRYYKIMYRR